MSHVLSAWKGEQFCTSISSHLFSSKILNCASLSRYDNGAGGGDATTTAVDGGAGAGGGAWAAGSAMISRKLQATFKTREICTKSGASQHLKSPTRRPWAQVGESNSVCAKMR